MNTQTKKIIEELCVDLSSELDDRYANRNLYPLLQSKYDAEMGVVDRAKKLIKESELNKDRYFIFYFLTNTGTGFVFMRTVANNFPSIYDVTNTAKAAVKNDSNPTISITGFNEFKSEDDYLEFSKGL